MGEVKVTLGRIEGMLGAKHMEYDRRLAELERSAAGALGKTMGVLSPIIAAAALLFAVAGKIPWA